MNPDPSNSASTGDDPTVNADAILKALANPVRREILAWLKDPKGVFRGAGHTFEHGVCAGHIDGRCGLSQSTVSRIWPCCSAPTDHGHQGRAMGVLPSQRSLIAAFLRQLNQDMRRPFSNARRRRGKRIA